MGDVLHENLHTDLVSEKRDMKRQRGAACCIAELRRLKQMGTLWKIRSSLRRSSKEPQVSE